MEEKSPGIISMIVSDPGIYRDIYAIFAYSESGSPTTICVDIFRNKDKLHTAKKHTSENREMTKSVRYSVVKLGGTVQIEGRLSIFNNYGGKNYCKL